MEPTAEQDGGEARRSRLRQRRTPASPTPPAVTTRSRAAQSESSSPSQRGKRKRSRSKGRKRARSTGREDEEDAKQEQAAASAASVPSEHAATGREGREDEKDSEQEDEVAAVSASSPAEHASSEASSAVSSPLRWPELPRAVKRVTVSGDKILQPFHEIDPATVKIHSKLVKKYDAKLSRQLKLVTLEQHIPRSCMLDLRVLPIRESASKMILQIAKLVMGLSSHIDGKLLRRASGFLIEWDAESKSGTVLTSAFLIQSKSPSVDEWLATDEYAPHAEVSVHLMDKADTTLVADLLHYDKHYNLALFKVYMDLPAQIPSFTSEVEFAEKVFVLGRDEGRNLIINHGNVSYRSPNIFQRHHYMFITCGINKVSIGGPVINLAGQVAGMCILPGSAAIPSSIILKCLQMLKSFNCIPRPHVGMKFSAISLLDLPHREKIACKCGFDDGLIITQVSQGSIAEILGVRDGDIIKSWNGHNISTAMELENFFLDMCEKHLHNGNSIGSSMDLSIDIFRIRKVLHDTIKMTINVSDEVEVIVEGTYPVTATTIVDECDDDDDDAIIPGEGSSFKTPGDEDYDIDIYP